MTEIKPKILAENVKEFETIEKELQKLPSSVYYQIDTARKGLLGIECTLRNSYGDIDIALPATTQLNYGDSGINAHCHNYFFRIPVEMRKYNIRFIFVEELNKRASVCLQIFSI